MGPGKLMVLALFVRLVTLELMSEFASALGVGRMFQTEPLVRVTVLVLAPSVKALPVSVEPLALRVAVLPFTTSNSGKRLPVLDVTTASFTLNVANEAVPGPPPIRHRRVARRSANRHSS